VTSEIASSPANRVRVCRVWEAYCVGGTLGSQSLLHQRTGSESWALPPRIRRPTE